jgi:hypothetical protein
MNTKLKSDDFYVLNSKRGDTFSVAGLLFLGELVHSAVQAAGLDSTKVCLGTHKEAYGAQTEVWVAFPSSNTRILTRIHVKDGYLSCMARHGGYKAKKFVLADPNLATQFGEFMKANMPKTSKYYEKQPVTND